VLGQAAILGGAVLFTTYIPDTDICEPEGVSRLYGLYYKTGTAYYDPILGVLGDTISTFVGLGKGLAITPSLHVGDKGVTAYIQTSSGAIETIELETPLNVKSGALFWRKRTN
jgi:type IV pilus assembly protein PilY1